VDDKNPPCTSAKGDAVAETDAEPSQLRLAGASAKPPRDARSKSPHVLSKIDVKLEYDVQAESAGSYDFAFRYAAESPGKTLHLEQDGKDISGAPRIGTPLKNTTALRAVPMSRPVSRLMVLDCRYPSGSGPSQVL